MYSKFSTHVLSCPGLDRQTANSASSAHVERQMKAHSQLRGTRHRESRFDYGVGPGTLAHTGIGPRELSLTDRQAGRQEDQQTGRGREGEREGPEGGRKKGRLCPCTCRSACGPPTGWLSIRHPPVPCVGSSHLCVVGVEFGVGLGGGVGGVVIGRHLLLHLRHELAAQSLPQVTRNPNPVDEEE